MARFFKISFAPLNIPLNRRLQTFAVWYTTTEFLFLGLISTIFLVFLLFTRFYFLTILYAGWLYFDWGVQNRGGRYIKWIRYLKLWVHFRDYFPVKLYKTQDLDPNKKYIFGFHPHGVVPVGATVNFASESTNFSQLFPGIKSRVITLDAHFKMPIHRDIMLMRGICSSNKESIEYLLSPKSENGTAIVIIIGGAIEALDAFPNTMNLTLKNRKGFIKLALKHGANLVPVLSFGENEIMKQKRTKEGTFIFKFQRWFKDVFAFSLPLIRGRGIFQYSIGYLPFRRPVNTVVGRPIEVTKCNNITDENVNKLHEEYCTKLRELFDENKEKFAASPTLEMIIK